MILLKIKIQPMINSILEITSLISGFLAAVYFILGTITLTSTETKNLGRTIWGGNPYLVAAFKVQKVDYRIGAIFLVCSFGLEISTHVLSQKILQLKVQFLLDNFLYFVLLFGLALFLISFSLRIQLRQPILQKLKDLKDIK